MPRATAWPSSRSGERHASRRWSAVSDERNVCVSTSSEPESRDGCAGEGKAGGAPHRRLEGLRGLGPGVGVSLVPLERCPARVEDEGNDEPEQGDGEQL